MIEAVNSSIANAQILRAGADRVSASSSVGIDVSAAPVVASDTTEAPKAPYVSPYISIDTKSNKAVLQIRNADTGEVEQQFPTKSRLAQLSQLQARYENEQKVRGAELPSFEDNPSSEAQAAGNIITVQDITSSAPSNSSIPSPEIAAAALSAGAQSGQSAPSINLSVLA